MWLDIKKQLDLVSRSFALCIPLLDEGLREIVGLAYLMLRALDCIEDSKMDNASKKLTYEKFLKLINDKAVDRNALCLYLKNQDWSGLKQEEVSFMTCESLSRMTDHFWSLGESYRLCISSCINEMACGMQKYSNFENKKAFVTLGSGKKILRDKNFYNDYCYYVAGTVGVLLTSLTHKFYNSKVTMTESVKTLALSFGRALQKVNIIKDCREDYRRGCCFLPQNFVTKFSCEIDAINLDLILNDVKHDFIYAKEYIFSLPKSYKSFKKFCLLALLPAYKTLIHIKKNQNLFYSKGQALKIPKYQMIKCFSMVVSGNLKKELVEKLHRDLFDQPSINSVNF